MKQIIRLTMLAICCFLATADEMHAETGRPCIIRKDRVWETLSSNYTGTQITSHFFKFDGTEERDGKTYDRLIAFKNIKYTQRPEAEILEKEDDIEDVHALIREEDGTVYTYIDETCLFTGICADQFKNKEYILYDFNKNEKEAYEGLGFLGGSDLGSFYYHVTKKDVIEIGEEKCRRIYVCISEELDFPYDYEYHHGQEIIEGIGLTEIGCLFYNEIYSQETSMRCDFRFLRVFDLDGNILYGDEDWMTPDGIQVGVEVTQQPSGRLVCDLHEVNVVSTHPCKINLVDMQGSLVASAAGTGKVSLPLAGLQRGVYVAIAESDGHVLDRRKILVK